MVNLGSVMLTVIGIVVVPTCRCPADAVDGVDDRHVRGLSACSSVPPVVLVWVKISSKRGRSAAGARVVVDDRDLAARHRRRPWLIAILGRS